jgi:1,4-dihydroxy-2-naphthoyl-CoA hydrolase
MTLFQYDRAIRFNDTDGAGVAYFANLMSICHEAYEASLVAAGVDVALYFQGQPVAVPLTHSSMDFRRPLRCGDLVEVTLQVTVLDESRFAIDYHLTRGSEEVATGRTEHVAIDSASRTRVPFPLDLRLWLHFHDVELA